MTRPPLVVHPAEHRGAFFRVLQETAASQTAVMTVAPGRDAGPEEEHAGDQIVYVIEGEADMRVGEERLTGRASEQPAAPGPALGPGRGPSRSQRPKAVDPDAGPSRAEAYAAA